MGMREWVGGRGRESENWRRLHTCSESKTLSIGMCYRSKPLPGGHASPEVPCQPQGQGAASERCGGEGGWLTRVGCVSKHNVNAFTECTSKESLQTVEIEAVLCRMWKREGELESA